MVSLLKDKPVRERGFKRLGLKAVRNLVEICDRDDVLPWRLLVYMGVTPEVLRPEEFSLLHDACEAAQRDGDAIASIHCADLLWRIADDFAIDGEVAQLVGGRECVCRLQAAVAHVLDGFLEAT